MSKKNKYKTVWTKVENMTIDVCTFT